MVITQLPKQRGAPPPGQGQDRGQQRAPQSRDWWRWAACRDADPELFFPVTAHGPGKEEIEQAKALCAGCRVRRQCLQFALATHQMHGVWGGTTEDERQLHVRRERQRGRARTAVGTVRSI